MKLFVQVAFIIGLLFSSIAQADSAKSGFGVVVGNPTGLQGQLPTADDKFLSATMGWELAGGNTDLSLGYLFRKQDAFHIQAYDMDLYYGPALKLKKTLGAGGMLGMGHPVEGSDYELFANSGLSFMPFDSGGLELDLYIGARYLFD